MAINFPTTVGQATDGSYTHTVGGLDISGMEIVGMLLVVI